MIKGVVIRDVTSHADDRGTLAFIIYDLKYILQLDEPDLRL